jgi:hypothetical protein
VALAAVPDVERQPSHEVVAAADGTRVLVTVPDPFAAGVCAGRLRAALWAEDLAGEVRFDADRCLLTVEVRPT